jgi:hypothetical protein
VVESTGAYFSDLLETINLSAGHLYLPAQSDKVVTRMGIATINVFQLADATTPVLTYSPVDQVP